MKSFRAAATLILFSGVSAFAADLPSIKSAPVAAPAPIWTGFYAGLNAGGAWSDNNTVNTYTWLRYTTPGNANIATANILSGPKPSSSFGGFIGGGQIGYNLQVPYAGYSFVTGIEADIQGIAGSGGRLNQSSLMNASISGFGFSMPYGISLNTQGSGNLSWLGTVRGRVGYLVMPALLIYGTGGLAYGNYSSYIQITQNWMSMVQPYDYLTYGSNKTSSTMVGWTAGGGAEWMFLPNWSAKVEYLYYDLGNASGSFTNVTYGLTNQSFGLSVEGATNYSKRINGNIVRAGVNYHFNFSSAPVVAKF